jgi:DNA-directed RNA polymerase specialized sigma24 family protein
MSPVSPPSEPVAPFHDLARRARLEGLYEDHAAAVHSYALRRVGEAHAREVLVESFVLAWRRLDDVPADPLPWLYTTARLVASTVPGVGFGGRGATELERQGFRALSGLRPNDREALLLVSWERLEPHRAAAALACSRGALRARARRGRKALARPAWDLNPQPELVPAPPIELLRSRLDDEPVITRVRSARRPARGGRPPQALDGPTVRLRSSVF